MANKAIFLDRDGTIISDPGYINDPSQVKLLDGSAEALVEIRKLDYKVVVVTNQSGIARGIIPEIALPKINEKLNRLLAEKNAYLDNIYYCPYHPDGVVKKYRKESNLRKPAPGMLLAAAKEMDIDLNQSWMVGDAYRDVAAGQAAGCKTVLIRSHTYQPMPTLDDPEPDFEAINLKEAVNIIKRDIVRSAQPKPKPAPSEPDTITPVEPDPVDPTPAPEAVATEPIRTPADKKKELNDLMLEAKTETPRDSTEQVLVEIRSLLKVMHRDKTFSDFSAMKLAAIILQILVIFCLMAAIWQKMSPAQDIGAVFAALGFAIVFQLMALTLYMVNDRR